MKRFTYMKVLFEKSCNHNTWKEQEKISKQGVRRVISGNRRISVAEVRIANMKFVKLIVKLKETIWYKIVLNYESFKNEICIYMVYKS